MASGKDISRRSFLAGTAAAGAAFALGRPFSIGRAQAATKGRVVILGFDGVEPSIAEEMMEAGELPNLAKLRNMGAFKRLQSTIPPQSPVAWSSFATCKNPGGHNIYDFIRRRPNGSMGPFPYVGTGKLDPATLTPEGEVSAPAKAESYRTGEAFWKVADAQGARGRILNVPFAFPADDLKNGVMLCGLGVPDLRGTTSTFFLLSDRFTPAQLQENVQGGQQIELTFDGADTAIVEMPGPRDQRYRYSDGKAFTKVPVEISVDRKAGQGKAAFKGKTVELKAGQWSEWLEWEFPVSPRLTVYSITRFFPLAIGEEVRLYMTCQQFHPEHAYVPISEPDEFASELQERYGLFKTIGWAYDTHALRQGALHENAFLSDVKETMAWRETLTLDEIKRGEFDLFISAWTATDRVGHMFWRYRDPKHPLYDPEAAKVFGKALEMTYKQMDSTVGKVMGLLTDDDLFMLLSDHGFESWRTGFNLNTWLRDNGYLAVNDAKRAAGGFLQGFDWQKTQAYSIGLSSLYLNMEGRETYGAVNREQSAKVLTELKEKLLAVKDPGTGMNVFSSIYTRDDFSGEAIDEAPDISLGYNQYYQNTKDTAKGAVGESLFEPNMDKWSGEHASSDMARLPGMLFCNKPVEKKLPHIQDLGVTALTYLGKDVPADFEGEAIA